MEAKTDVHLETKPTGRGVVFNTNTDFIRSVQTQQEQQDEDNEPLSIALKKKLQQKKKAMKMAAELIEEKMEVEGVKPVEAMEEESEEYDKFEVRLLFPHSLRSASKK